LVSGAGFVVIGLSMLSAPGWLRAVSAIAIVGAFLIARSACRRWNLARNPVAR
jgi:hypothetical protein